jgi:hypothetical protein
MTRMGKWALEDQATQVEKKEEGIRMTNQDAVD